jgi:hypothetical protein
MKHLTLISMMLSRMNSIRSGVIITQCLESQPVHRGARVAHEKGP